MLTIYCTNFGEKYECPLLCASRSVRRMAVPNMPWSLACVPQVVASPAYVYALLLVRLLPSFYWHVCPICGIVFAFDCPLACKLSFWSSLVAVVSATWWMDLFLQEFFVRRNSWHSAWLQALVTLCIVMSRMCLHCLEDILLCVRVECGCGVVFGSEFCARHLCLVMWKHIFSTVAVMCMDFAWTLFEFK